MRHTLKLLIALAPVIVLVSCFGGGTDIPNAQGKSTGILKDDQVIDTESKLSALLKSMKNTDKRTVTLIGKLDLVEATNFKHQVSTLVIGKTPLAFGHSVDKDKYHNQTVLVKADVVAYTPPNQESKYQRLGFWVLNVQHIEIIKKP
jgi:hypothetical protein